jgi:hypothetical protein
MARLSPGLRAFHVQGTDTSDFLIECGIELAALNFHKPNTFEQQPHCLFVVVPAELAILPHTVIDMSVLHHAGFHFCCAVEIACRLNLEFD